MLDKRRIGSSELEVNAVGLGCMGFSHAYGAPTERNEATKMIRRAFDFLYSIIERGYLPMRILIGKKCCEDVRGFPGDRTSEIDSYINELSQTDF